MSYDLADIARETVDRALTESGIGEAQFESFFETGDFERVVAVMVESTFNALEWGSKTLLCHLEREEIMSIAVEAVFDVLALRCGVSPDALRLASLIVGSAEIASLANLSDEVVTEAIKKAADDLGIDLRPIAGTRDVVDEAGEIIARFVKI